jgi:hypothetical protein
MEGGSSQDAETERLYLTAFFKGGVEKGGVVCRSDGVGD